MLTEELKKQRIKNLNDATNFREPDKVPVGIETITWPIAYAGVKLQDVLGNPAALAKAYTRFLDDIEVDFYSMAMGISVPVKSYEALESDQYVISDDGICIQHYQANDKYMQADEFDEMIDDFTTFKNEKMMKRRYPIFTGPRDHAYESLKEAAIAFKTFVAANALIEQDIEAHGIVILGNITNPFEQKAPSYYAPFNVLFDTFRGMKNSLIDLRRRPDTVRAAVKAIEASKTPAMVPPEFYQSEDSYPFTMTIYHSECFLNNKQFDELYFQGFKKRCMPYMENGAKYFLKGEGQFLNTLDRFKELPKSSMIIILDEDDPFEAYKHIKDYHTLAAGIKSDLMQHGTKQQCIDYVKKCFDTFAPGGGFIFHPNKPLISALDVNPENLIAVYEFANEYGKKR